MALHVITGRSGSGKTAYMLNEIIEKIESGSDENIILIVPEQMSFQAEYAITKRVTGKTVANLQVLSFKRLAYRIFLEVGGASKEFISDQTIMMMLTKILLEQKDRLKVYHRMQPNYHFISLFYDVIKEFKSYAYTPETFQAILASDEYDQQMKEKMHDFSLVFNELIRLYGDTLRDEEDFYRELSERILDSNYVKESVIYIDGYHVLTGVEMNVLLSLIKTAKSVNWLLTIDELDKTHEYYQPDHLFYPVYQTATKVFNRCHEEDINVTIKKHFFSQQRFKAKELAFLERTYEQPEQVFEGEVSHIQIHECMRPESEVHHVARMIYQELLNGASLNDFVIYTNNELVYYPLIKNIFKLYNLPVFIDDGEKMLDHSLLNFVDAALEIVKTNYRHDAMFRAIKTEMLMPLEVEGLTIDARRYPHFIRRYREQLDELENYCLAHGINHEDWLNKDFTVDFHKRINDRERVKTEEDLAYENMLNTVKKQIMAPLQSFVDNFTASPYVKDKIKALYELLEAIQVEEKLALYETLDEQRSNSIYDLERVKKHKQVYNKLIDLFDELVLVCGDYEMDTDAFIKILRNGFKAMTFQLYPPALEQIMVGDLKRSRFELLNRGEALGVKKAFILGINEGEFPKVYHEQGLLSNKEREALLELGFDCDLTVEQAFLNENFYIYLAMASPSDDLILTYSLSDQEKKESFRSYIIDDLLKKFPKLRVETIYDFPEMEDDPYVYITTPTMTTSHLLEALHLQQKDEDIHPVWLDVYQYYLSQPSLKRRLNGLYHKNTPDQLKKDDIKVLFGDTLTVSVSSLEQYNSCPYAFFLEKGLRIKERDVKKVEAVDIGNLYHETLKDLAYILLKEQKELHELELETIESIVDERVNALARKVQREFFYDNERNQYLLKKIKTSLFNSIIAMRYQSEHSSFKVFAVEEKFGSDAKRLVIPEKEVNGFQVQLKGFIDRIDYAKEDDKTLVRVIDYKSGAKSVDFSKIFYRLSLQLFTYLDVVLQSSELLFPGEDVIPAGVLYYHIFNSRIRANEELTVEDIEGKHYREYRMEGYTLQDLKVSRHFDGRLEIGKGSDIVPLTLTKSGYHRSHSKVLAEDELNLVRQYTRTAIENSVKEIISGDISINPAKYENEPPLCQYCAFKAVCKHDVTRPENHYRLFDRFKNRNEAIEKMKEILEGEDAHEVE